MHIDTRMYLFWMNVPIYSQFPIVSFCLRSWVQLHKVHLSIVWKGRASLVSAEFLSSWCLWRIESEAKELLHTVTISLIWKTKTATDDLQGYSSFTYNNGDLHDLCSLIFKTPNLMKTGAKTIVLMYWNRARKYSFLVVHYRYAFCFYPPPDFLNHIVILVFEM